MRSISVALLSEIWGKQDNKLFQRKLEEIIEMEGFGSHCLNRKFKRGGGVAIIFNTEEMEMIDPEIVVPHNLEIVWRVGSPKKGQIKDIIFAALYYPPKARKKVKMINHIIETLQSLLTRYSEAQICLGGDKNELKISDILNGTPGLKQVATSRTYK